MLLTAKPEEQLVDEDHLDKQTIEAVHTIKASGDRTSHKEKASLATLQLYNDARGVTNGRVTGARHKETGHHAS
jgi:hypothetical protein